MYFIVYVTLYFSTYRNCLMSWAKVLCVLITGPLFCITHSKSSNANILLRISWDRGSRGPVGSISQQTVHFLNTMLIKSLISSQWSWWDFGSGRITEKVIVFFPIWNTISNYLKGMYHLGAAAWSFYTVSWAQGRRPSCRCSQTLYSSFSPPDREKLVL